MCPVVKRTCVSPSAKKICRPYNFLCPFFCVYREIHKLGVFTVKGPKIDVENTPPPLPIWGSSRVVITSLHMSIKID